MQWWAGEKSSREANLEVDHGCEEDTGMDREDLDHDHADLHLLKIVSSVDERIPFLATPLKLNPCRSADLSQKNISVRTCNQATLHTILSGFVLLPLRVPLALHPAYDLVQQVVRGAPRGNC